LTLAFATRRNSEEALFDYNFRGKGGSFENFNTLLASRSKCMTAFFLALCI